MRDFVLGVPHFRRLDEYLGVWCHEPERFQAQWMFIRGTDLAAHMAAGPPPRGVSLELVPGTGDKSIAVLKATGTLMKQQPSMGGTSTIQLRRDIRQAAADQSVSAILLAIDSPGGTVAGLADLAADVRAARKKKPVWAHIDDLGASAAYHLASQADAIYANSADALVGSIGTMAVVYDQSGLAEREGVKALLFATGPLKGAGTPGTVVTEEQRAYYQGLVDGMQKSFDHAVRVGRGMTRPQLDAVKTGGVFLAAEAKQLGLIDGIRPIGATLAALAAQK